MGWLKKKAKTRQDKRNEGVRHLFFEVQLLDGDVAHAELLYFARHRFGKVVAEQPVLGNLEVGHLRSSPNSLCLKIPFGPSKWHPFSCEEIKFKMVLLIL